MLCGLLVSFGGLVVQFYKKVGWGAMWCMVFAWCFCFWVYCFFWVLHGCEPLGHAVGDLVVLVNLHQVLVAVMTVRVNHGVIRLRKHGHCLWLRNQGFTASEVRSLVVV